MTMMLLKGLGISVGVIFGLGLIRLMFKHPATFLEALTDVFFLDVLFEVLGEVFSNID
jgi:hypothetical protein